MSPHGERFDVILRVVHTKPPSMIMFARFIIATLFELRDLAGWSDTRPAEAYVQRSGQSLRRLQERIAKERG